MRERSDQSALREHAAAIGRESGPDPRLKLARMGLAPARAMKHELGGSIWMRISIAEAGEGARWRSDLGRSSLAVPLSWW